MSSWIEGMDMSTASETAQLPGDSAEYKCPGCDKQSCNNTTYFCVTNNSKKCLFCDKYYEMCNNSCDFYNRSCDIYEYVYRIDSRDPDIIFSEGFEAKQTMDLRATVDSHLNGATQCFISTTFKYPGLTDPDEVPNEDKISTFSRLISGLCKEGEAFVYKIRANQNFYNVLGTLNACVGTEIYRKNEFAIDQLVRMYKHEEELFSIEKILPQSIHSAVHWIFDEETEKFDPYEFLSNEIFDDKLTSASNKNPFPKII